jgi:DNA-binding response OmpR family regulator
MDGGIRVLVVDDDPDIAQFVRTVLSRAGMQAVASVVVLLWTVRALVM